MTQDPSAFDKLTFEIPGEIMGQLEEFLDAPRARHGRPQRHHSFQVEENRNMGSCKYEIVRSDGESICWASDPEHARIIAIALGAMWPAAHQDLVTLVGGEPLYTHKQDKCAGEPCCIHAPSAHSLLGCTQRWNAQTRHVERQCAHGLWHPDPDALSFQRRINPGDGAPVHPCDSCCVP